MRFSPKLPWNVRRLFRLPGNRDRMLRELDDEVRTHVEMRVEHLRSLGKSEAEARAEAMRRFGDAEEFRVYAERRVAGKAHRLRRAQWFAEWLQDVRFAARQFAKAPGFVTIAVLTLALGIGANTAIFSVVHKLLLAPLPYPNGNRIVIPIQQLPDGGHTALDLALIQAWRSTARSVDMVAVAEQAGMFSVSGDGSVVRIPNGNMSANYLELLGGRPAVGRGFSPAEEAAEQPNVALISYGLWQREHGGNAAVVGSVIRMNDRSYTIVGVTPPGLAVPLTSTAPPDIWLPQSIDRLDKNGQQVFARLRPGVTVDAALRELQAVATRVPAPARGRAPLRLMRVQDFLDPREVRSVQVLFVAVGVLLLIACANVANLLLARAWTRRREFAVRTALGAGRGRLARQVLTESMLLAFAGAAPGVGVAWGTLRGIIAVRPQELDHLAEVKLEPVVLFWSLGIAITTGLLFGCAPAIVAAARKAGDVLRTESRAASADLMSRRVRSTLIVVEIAMSLVLLVGAGLLARSFGQLQRARLGFEPAGLSAISAMINAPVESGRHSAIRAAALQRVSALPGVVDAAVGGMPSSGGPSARLETEPDASGQSVQAEDVPVNLISADYFRVARIALVEGRTPDSAAATADWKAGKDWGSSGEVVVNRALAQRLWPNGRAVGSHVRQVAESGKGQPARWSTVVGVVEDTRAPGDRRAGSAPQMYSLMPPGYPINWFVIRTRGRAEASGPVLERTVRAVDPALIVWRLVAGETYVRNGRAPARFAVALLGAFAIIAVILAGVGLYGVIHYGVNQRTREIGVRVALGASPQEVARLIVGGGLALALAGVTLGTVIAAATTRVLTSLLYGVNPADPLTFAAIAALVAAIAVVASYVPARRALRISPVEALRAD